MENSRKITPEQLQQQMKKFVAQREEKIIASYIGELYESPYRTYIPQFIFQK
jgi:hypothetical protein